MRANKSPNWRQVSRIPKRLQLVSRGTPADLWNLSEIVPRGTSVVVGNWAGRVPRGTALFNTATAIVARETIRPHLSQSAERKWLWSAIVPRGTFLRNGISSFNRSVKYGMLEPVFDGHGGRHRGKTFHVELSQLERSANYYQSVSLDAGFACGADTHVPRGTSSAPESLQMSGKKLDHGASRPLLSQERIA
jgi:hypothetical protein